MNTKLAVQGNGGRNAYLFVVTVVAVMLLVSAAVAAMRFTESVVQFEASRVGAAGSVVVASTTAETASDGYAFYTERYYEAAAAREVEVAAAAEKDYAFYSERYYDAAAAREAKIAAEAANDYAFYTERYYEAAAARDAKIAGAEQEKDYAFYTERYWEAAAAREAAAASAENETLR